MRNAVKGIALIAAVVLLGAGCNSSLITPNPGPQPVPAKRVPPSIEQGSGSNGADGTPVTHEEPNISNPDQNY